MEEIKITSKIIADSLAPDGTRLTSYVATFPRMVLAEFNTHRKFSRNSASSRAIPFPTMLRMVRDTPFIPLKFQRHHKGMQGDEYLTGKDEELARQFWLEGRDAAMKSAVNQTFPCARHSTLIGD